MKGIDTVDNRVLAVDAGSGQLKQSTDWGANWSTSKGLPSDVSWSNISVIVRFGDYLYALAKETTSGLAGVYRTLPASGNNSFSWSSLLVTFDSGSTFFQNNLSCDDTYLYAAEYGDPSSGPSIYRTSDGTTWETVFGPQASWRHIHAVQPDPFNSGHVWMTGGDGVDGPIKYSVDSGGTWSDVAEQSGSVPQCTGIGFTHDWVVLAADAEYASIVVIDKANKTWRYGCSNWHGNFAIPGSSNMFDPSPFYIAVDSDTDIIYLPIPSNVDHPTVGLFYLTKIGGRLELLTYGEASGYSIVANGELWSGAYHRSLMTVEELA